MPLTIAIVVASVLAPDAPNARIARMRAAGAAPISRARAAIAPAIAGAVRVRLLGLAKRVERAGNRALEFGMAEVDAGVDHRDQDLVAVGKSVRLADAKLGERILRGIAGRGPRGRGRDRRRRLRSGLRLRRKRAAAAAP